MTWGSMAWLSLFGPQIFYERHDLSWAISIWRQDVQIVLLMMFQLPLAEESSPLWTLLGRFYLALLRGTFGRLDAQWLHMVPMSIPLLLGPVFGLTVFILSWPFGQACTGWFPKLLLWGVPVFLGNEGVSPSSFSLPQGCLGTFRHNPRFFLLLSEEFLKPFWVFTVFLIGAFSFRILSQSFWLEAISCKKKIKKASLLSLSLVTFGPSSCAQHNAFSGIFWMQDTFHSIHNLQKTASYASTSWSNACWQAKVSFKSCQSLYHFGYWARKAGRTSECILPCMNSCNQSLTSHFRQKLKIWHNMSGLSCLQAMP